MTTVEVKKPEREIPDSPEIKRQAEYVYDCKNRLMLAEQGLADMIARFQHVCEHSFEAVTKYDREYHGRLDCYDRGQDIFLGKRCKKCKAFVARAGGYPWQICYKCGGKMKFDRHEQFGMDRAIVHKCEDCGHEHDTM